MATKNEILDLANRGNWDNFQGEERCPNCGEYRFMGKHKDDCPLGILLQLIKDSDLE